MRLFFVTGYLGALTTFSTYGMETVTALQEGTHMVAVSNILANNVIGAALVFLGILAGRLRWEGKAGAAIQKNRDLYQRRGPLAGTAPLCRTGPIRP